MKCETIEAINKAVDRARNKWPVFPSDVIYQSNLLAEEAGEVAQEANDLIHYELTDKSLYEAEILDLLAVCIRILEKDSLQ
jgi:NTP pyrophosphatase (non-canonical NTP hydrolase)